MTYDLKVGRAPVLVFTDKRAADRIAAALKAESEHFFQADGAVVVVESDRDKPAEVVETDFASQIHALKLADVIGAIEAADDVESVRHVLEAENANPRSAGPRVSVVKAAEARIEVFEADPVE